MTKQEMNRLFAFAAAYACCPCCRQSVKCLEGCTIERDTNAEYFERMTAARFIAGKLSKEKGEE